MKAITTRYFAPGNVRPPRYRATDGDGNTFYMTAQDLSVDENHEEAARKLCRKMGWNGRWIEGHLLKGGHGDARVWVCLSDKHSIARQFDLP